MSNQNLTTVISVFNQSGFVPIEINTSHATHFHVYYKVDGKNRVILVPKKIEDEMTLRMEIGILLSRNSEEQMKVGANDHKPRYLA